MARGPSKPEGTSRIRFIMLEAEIPSGDIHQVTQAIQNALRPATLVHQRVSGPGAAQMGGDEGPNADNSLIDLTATEVNDGDEGQDRAPRRPNGSSKPRTYRSPDVLDIDLTTAPSWESFAADHTPEADTDRFLTVAAWFKECRGEDTVTADHVYTCFRAAKWPTAISDFSSPLRNLKQSKLMSTPERGKYAINHLGISRVQELKRH